MKATMGLNPFAMPLVDAAIAAAPDAMTAVEVLDAFESGFKPHATKEFKLYRRTVRALAHARILAFPSPSTRRANERLLEALDRQGCEDAKLLARCWKNLGGEVFDEECRAASVAYLDSAERTRIKRTSQRFAGMIRTWGRSVKSGGQRTAWAEGMLSTFGGHELLVIGRKTMVDPGFVVLCRFVGRPVPTVAELKAASASGAASGSV